MHSTINSHAFSLIFMKFVIFIPDLFVDSDEEKRLQQELTEAKCESALSQRQNERLSKQIEEYVQQCKVMCVVGDLFLFLKGKTDRRITLIIKS